MMSRRFFRVMAASCAAIFFCGGANSGDVIVDPVCSKTPRVVTDWVKYSHGKAECLKRARETFKSLDYKIDPKADSTMSIFGLKDEFTVSVRCDLDGVAVFIIAYSTLPDPAAERVRMKEVTSPFSNK